MKRKGSITVFLSLLLVLLFSFVLTTLEAARITGSMAYLQMLSLMAGDSVLAEYYYPLFEQYGLLGVAAADEVGYFSGKKITDGLTESLSYGAAGLKGGLLDFTEPETELVSYHTMLSQEGEAFLHQLRQQTALEGASAVLSALLSEADFKDAAHVSELYKKQEETLAETATVTQELLRLMELADGIAADEEGLVFDKEGRLQTNPAFIKQLADMTEEELREKYENEEIFNAVKGGFFSPKEKAQQLSGLLMQAMAYQAEIAVYEAEIEGYQKRQKELVGELLEDISVEKLEQLLKEEALLAEKIKQAKAARDDRVEWLDIVLMDAEAQYAVLKGSLEAVEPLLGEALEIVRELEIKQLAAQASVNAYGQFLSGMQESVSAELYTVFENELQKLKLYVGLEEQGYRVPVMQATLEQNLTLLERVRLPAFSADKLSELNRALQLLAEEIAGYSTEGLWFIYGEITAAKSLEGSVLEQMENILSMGILSLAGLSSEEVSEQALQGQELPSEDLAKESITENLLDCFSEMSAVFQQEGIAGILMEGAQYSLDMLVLEAYGRSYLGCFGKENPYTRLAYEREYVLFGEKKDSQNLFYTVLHLVALRSVFTMVSIVKDAAKMAELETLAAAVAGFTGVPLLLSVVKYGLLLVWAVEEAFIETAALLDGKRLPLISMQGKLLIGELFLFHGELVQQKAAAFSDMGTGFAYEDYITLLSLTRGVQKKAFRIMDLIQENIRYRYNDAFRMRNVVTSFAFQTRTILNQMLQTGIWTEEVYRLKVREEMSY